MVFNLDQEMDKLAHLVAQRAKRKQGLPRDLRLVEGDRLAEPGVQADNQRLLPDSLNFQPIDVSDRAKKIRAIMRIADRFGWHDAVIHFLETRGACYPSDLTDPQLDDLQQRMEGYVDAAETGCSLENYLPGW